MYRLNVKTESGEVKAIRINGKYCGKTCEFKKKMFQGYGGWLGFEVDGCTLSGQLSTSESGCVRCERCLKLCKDQIENNGAHWEREAING